MVLSAPQPRHFQNATNLNTQIAAKCTAAASTIAAKPGQLLPLRHAHPQPPLPPLATTSAWTTSTIAASGMVDVTRCVRGCQRRRIWRRLALLRRRLPPLATTFAWTMSTIVASGMEVVMRIVQGRRRRLIRLRLVLRRRVLGMLRIEGEVN
jgi:hypothetical protein